MAEPLPAAAAADSLVTVLDRRLDTGAAEAPCLTLMRARGAVLALCDRPGVAPDSPTRDPGPRGRLM